MTETPPKGTPVATPTVAGATSTDDGDLVTVLHNPRCSTSRFAVDRLTEAGVPHTAVRYLSEPLDETALRDVVARLEDPVTDLVRRDAGFARAGLSEADVADADGVVAALLAHPELVQRPVLLVGTRAFIVRPKSRVDDLIAGRRLAHGTGDGRERTDPPR